MSREVVLVWKHENIEHSTSSMKWKTGRPTALHVLVVAALAPISRQMKGHCCVSLVHQLSVLWCKYHALVVAVLVGTHLFQKEIHCWGRSGSLPAKLQQTPLLGLARLT